MPAGDVLAFTGDADLHWNQCPVPDPACPAHSPNGPNSRRLSQLAFRAVTATVPQHGIWRADPVARHPGPGACSASSASAKRRVKSAGTARRLALQEFIVLRSSINGSQLGPLANVRLVLTYLTGTRSDLDSHPT